MESGGVEEGLRDGEGGGGTTEAEAGGFALELNGEEDADWGLG